MTDDRDITRRIAITATRLGFTPCGDRGCIFGHHGYIALNGGCQHLKSSPTEMRWHVQAMQQICRALAAELEGVEP